MNEYKVPEGCVLILRTCDADMTSYGDFRWPESGPVECPDWDPRPVCRHGLRGLLWGAGDGSLLRWYDTAIWIVAEVDASQIVDLGGKIKAPRANVIYAGDRQTATELIARHAPSGTVIVGHTASAGYGGTASVGYYGTASAGDYGTASAGDGGTATAGDGGTIMIRYIDGRLRVRVGYIGEDGLLPNVKYRLDGNAKFVLAAGFAVAGE